MKVIRTASINYVVAGDEAATRRDAARRAPSAAVRYNVLRESPARLKIGTWGLRLCNWLRDPVRARPKLILLCNIIGKIIHLDVTVPEFCESFITGSYKFSIV